MPVNSPQENPPVKDGALMALGILSTSLMKVKKYSNNLDKMVELYVLPALKSNYPFLRARVQIQNY